MTFAPPIRSTRIMAYHGVHPNPVDGITHSPDIFAFQMARLAARGYKVVTLAELCRGAAKLGRWPYKMIALTFDDGYADCFEFAAPVLREHGFTATVFIITDSLEASALRPLHCHPRKEFLTETQVAALAAQGWEIGSHSCNHTRLAAIPEWDQQRQIFDSKEILESRFGISVTSFCYPGGSLTKKITNLVREAGYTQAVVTPWHADSVIQGDWLTLERVGFYPGDGTIKYHLKLSRFFHLLRRTRLLVGLGGDNHPG